MCPLFSSMLWRYSNSKFSSDFLLTKSVSFWQTSSNQIRIHQNWKNSEFRKPKKTELRAWTHIKIVADSDLVLKLS